VEKQHGLVPESYETYQIVNQGNIIIRGTDLQNDKTSLRIGLSQNRGIISSAYLCLETKDAVSPEFGYQILNAYDLTKAIYRYGSGLRQNLDHGEIKRLPIFIPPPDEQAAIVRFTGISVPHLSPEQIKGFKVAIPPQDEQLEIVESIARTEQEIDFLREFRTRLISDVVTGKLDVRAAAQHLPASPEDTEAPIEADELPDDADEPDAEPTEAVAD